MLNSHNILLTQGAKHNGNGKCRSCEQPVRWYKMRSGATQPYDPPSRELTNDPDSKPWQDWEMLSHFATCPNSAEHKRDAANKRTQEALAQSLQRQPSLFESEAQHG